MKIVTKILCGLLAIPLVLLALVAVVQTFYRLTPVGLSAEALALNTRAARLPVLTENGYRLYGLLAPREQDAVVFGKCLLDAQQRHPRDENARGVKAPPYEDKVAWADYEKQSSARFNVLYDGCTKGGTPLTLPKVLTDVRVNLATTEDQWRALAAAALDETVQARADAVRGGGVRRLAAEVDSPFPSYDRLMKLERLRIARGVVAWRDGECERATDLWRAAIADGANSGNSTLIDAMLSVAAQTQVLIAMQGSVAQSARIDDAIADALLAAIKPIETMPDVLANSMVAEWQTHVSLMKQMSENPMLSLSFGAERNVFERAMDRISAWTFDANDTMNAIARANLWSQDALLKAGRGQAQPEYPADMLALGCKSDGDWGLACLPFLRNPVGRFLSAIAMPTYASYGVRVADLRNSAAATRLTIEARRRQLAGDALVQFVENASGDMRDVFTGRPFFYDSLRKRLSIELRERSTILGDKGTYELQL